MRALAFALLLLSLGLQASPAEARLGAPIEQFQNSPLIQGDRLFHFEGQFGSRYRFSGASHCLFGQGVLALDVWGRQVVQESLVLPLPADSAAEVLVARVAGMVLDDAALKPAEREKAMSAFLETVHSAKKNELKLERTELHTYCVPSLNSVMLVVSLKP